MAIKKKWAAITGLSVGGVILSGLCWVYFFQSRPIGDGPAGMSVRNDLFDHPWTERKIFVVGMGDSVTAGFGARPGYSYFDRLIANPPDEFADMRGKCLSAVFPRLYFTNLAISGTTSGEHVSRELPRLPFGDSNTVALVFMTTGGNDLIHNYGKTPPRELAAYGATAEQAAPWVANFEARLEQMLQAVRRHFPGGCEVFLATIFDPTDDLGDIYHAGLPAWPDGGRILNMYNDIIIRMGQRHDFVHIVDNHQLFLGHGIHCTQFWRRHYNRSDPHYWYYVNLEDPNERGYDAMRRLFLTEIGNVRDRLK